MTALGTRWLSVQDYHRMIEVGIFGPEERVELLAGQLILKDAKSPLHCAVTTRARRVLEERLGDSRSERFCQRVLVSVQNPVILDDWSEPEPDLAVVRPDPLDYGAGHPMVADIFLLVEVADSSLKFDREVKALAYGKAGVMEYWVVDVVGRRLHVFRSPGPEGYGVEMTLARSEKVRLLAFGDCEVGVGELFG
jgi:Uma2 family endonuclease